MPSQLEYHRGMHGGVLTSPKDNPQLQMYLYNPFSNHKKAAGVPGGNPSLSTSQSRVSATKLNQTISHIRSFS